MEILRNKCIIHTNLILKKFTEVSMQTNSFIKENSSNLFSDVYSELEMCSSLLFGPEDRSGQEIAELTRAQTEVPST